MIETLILAVTSFVGTNIDDIVINTLFFTEAKTKTERKNIVIGKYVGIGTLTILSVIGAFGLQFLPQHYIGYLGFVPIGLGIREVIAGLKTKGADETNDRSEKEANKMMNIAIITLSNGADNIGVYIPLFAGFAVWQIVLTVCVFFVLIMVWCVLGKALAELPVLRNALTRYKSITVPVVYIALGVYILLKNLI